VSIERLLKQMKDHPDYNKAGMVLCHNGIVRETSRDGRAVTGLSVEVDENKLADIIAEQKKRKGIIEILVEINAGKELKVGDDVMFIVVAGDIRDIVVPVLSDTLNAIKSTVTRKTEFFV